MDTATAIKQRAQACIKRGQFDKAMAEYLRLVASDGSDPGTFILIGDLHIKMNQPTDAIDRYTEAVDAYVKLGLSRNAIAVLKKILRTGFGTRGAHGRLAELYQEKGLLAESFSHHLELASTCNEEGDTEAAIQSLTKLSELDTPNARLAVRAADLWVTLGDAARAVEELDRRAHHLSERGRAEQARTLIEHARSINPGFQPSAGGEPVVAAYDDPDESSAASDPAEASSGEPKQPTVMPGLERSGDLFEPVDLPAIPDGAAAVANTGDSDAYAPEIELPAGPPAEDLQPSEAPTEEPVELPAESAEPAAESAEPPVEPVELPEPAAENHPAEPTSSDEDITLPDAAPREAADEEQNIPIYELDAEPASGGGLSFADFKAGIEEDVAADAQAAEDDWRATLQTYLDARDHEQAVALLLERAPLAELDGDDGEAVELFEWLWELGHREEMVAAHLAAISERTGELPQAARWKSEVGELRLSAGEWEPARTAFQEALALDPGQELAIRRLERLAHVEATDEESPAAAEQAAPAAPAPERAPQRGAAAPGPAMPPSRTLGPEQVAQILDRFVEDVGSQLDADDHSSHYDLALAFLEMGLDREAITQLEQAAEGDAFRQRSQELLATCYSRVGEYEQAAQVLRAVLDAMPADDPRHADVRVQLATALVDSGQRDEARSLLESVVEHHPDHQDAQQALRGLG